MIQQQIRPVSGVVLLICACALLSACSDKGVALQLASRGSLATTPWEGPVPKAQCGANDRVETGLQGQVSLVDRLSGRVREGYNCNLELVGQWRGEGASWQHAWYEDCAYYDQADRIVAGADNQNPLRPSLQNPGTVVVDASDPANPVATAWLTEPAMIDPWESLRVHQGRGLLMGVEEEGPGFSIYDVAGDCTQPELLASIDMFQGGLGHEGTVSPDGRTYYGASVTPITAIDLDKPSQPTSIASISASTHGLSIREDGRRAYLAQSGLGSVPGQPPGNGLVILDVGEVQDRLPDPQVPVISETLWLDGSAAQSTIHVTYAGVPHVIFFDEAGSVIGSPQAACAQGLPPSGFPRIFDISDETQPRLVAKVMQEVDDPANCAMVMNDNTAHAVFTYDSHYCNVDRATDPRMMACGRFSSGLRVYDIRDPYQPREIAYYNPPIVPGYQPGSNVDLIGECLTKDWAPSMPRLWLERQQIWFTSMCGGFQILRFTKSMDELLSASE